MAAHAGAINKGAIEAFIVQYQQAHLAVAQDQVNARKVDINRSINDLTYAYGKHEITAKQFHKRVGAILKADLPGYKQIGNLMGTAIAGGIENNVKGLFAQAKALVGFTGRPGTDSAEAKITSPLKTLHTDQQKIAHIQTQIKDKHGAYLARIAKASESRRELVEKEKGILDQIAALDKTSAAKNPGHQARTSRHLGRT